VNGCSFAIGFNYFKRNASKLTISLINKINEETKLRRTSLNNVCTYTSYASSMLLATACPIFLLFQRQTTDSFYGKEHTLWVCSFISADRSRTKSQKHSMGSDRPIVGPGRNHLLRTEPFLMWFVAELSNSELVH
jgi:hypothetical protein